jgi:putative ABC transport system permease protein
MLKNIIVTSLRNFFRNKSFSIINLVGLSVSMSLGMLIIMIIKEQFSFDKFHSDSERIYRINTLLHHPEWGTIDFASAPLPVGRALEDDYSLSENVVRINRQFHADASYLNVNLPLKGLIVDPSFNKLFNFPFQSGNPASALTAPNSLVLTKQTAERIFGTANPIGETISLSKYGEFTITGVLQAFEGKTHLDFEMLCSISTLPALEKRKVLGAPLDDWTAFYDNYVYFKLKKGRTSADVEQALAEINKKYCNGLRSEGRDVSYDFYLQPLARITPGPELSGQMGKGMPSSVLVFLAVLASVVLLMSVFNFTSLTIAKSLSRAREIGVRKVVGAKRHQVFMQFIGESVFFSIIALAFSYVVLQLLKEGFLLLSFNEHFAVDLKEDLSLYGLFICFAVVVGLIAGVLPAAYLSAFRPSRVLKDAHNLRVYARLTFRKILMVAQFTLSVIFVIIVLVIYQQVDFMLTADYGIEQRNNLQLQLHGTSFEKIDNDLRSVPGVERVGAVSHRLGTWEDNSSDYKRTKSDKTLAIRDFMVDDNYINNISLNFIAGRNFDPLEQLGREKDVILNETAVASLSFEDPVSAIGQTIYAEDTLPLRVIGVVKDFHFRPLNNQIGPLALRYNLRDIGFASIKIDPSQKTAVIESLKTIWKKHDPIHPLDYEMMEEEIDDAYRQAGMNDMVVIVGYIAFLVISLACMGMLGMAMYSSQVRAKEVSIRKVMGASVADVVMLLSKSFMLLIGIASIIGIPLSFFLGEMFLQDFAYKIQITPLLIECSIAIIAGLGLLITCSQTIIVAMSNPVRWIRNE